MLGVSTASWGWQLIRASAGPLRAAALPPVQRWVRAAGFLIVVLYEVRLALTAYSASIQNTESLKDQRETLVAVPFWTLREFNASELAVA